MGFRYLYFENSLYSSQLPLRNYHCKLAHGQLSVDERTVVRVLRAYRNIKMIGNHEFISYKNSQDFTFCQKKLRITSVNKWGMS